MYRYLHVTLDIRAKNDQNVEIQRKKIAINKHILFVAQPVSTNRMMTELVP